jgi:hypothetical protein
MNECVLRRNVCEEGLRKWKCVSPRAGAGEIYIIVLYQLAEFKYLILCLRFINIQVSNTSAEISLPNA